MESPLFFADFDFEVLGGDGCHGRCVNTLVRGFEICEKNSRWWWWFYAFYWVLITRDSPKGL